MSDTIRQTPSPDATIPQAVCHRCDATTPSDAMVKLAAVNFAQQAELVRLRAAMEEINTIRNSIIGLSVVNWSEHVYPLVAALNRAGFDGMDYPEARENFGTLLDRNTAAEAETKRLRAALAVFASPESWAKTWKYGWVHTWAGHGDPQAFATQAMGGGK